MLPTSFAPPRRLHEGSTIAVIAPSSPFERAEVEAGIARLRTRYEVRYDDDLFATDGYLAGNDVRRTAELNAALDDENVDAIVAARGGYGAARILENISVEKIARTKKLLVGFSDVTALHALWANANLRSIHGPMVAGLGRDVAKPEGDARWQRWVRAVEGDPYFSCAQLEANARGVASGILYGGNLAVLASLLGTPYFPNVDGGVLFLEDIGERPYRVDRMLTQLRSAGVFDRVSAVICGQFTDCKAGKDEVTIESVLKERLGSLALPVCFGLGAGHVDDNLPLPFGVRVTVDATNGSVFTTDSAA